MSDAFFTTLGIVGLLIGAIRLLIGAWLEYEDEEHE